MARHWFAVQADRDDNDWGMGFWALDEAITCAKANGFEIIAEIDAGYDDAGNATADPVCVAEYAKGIDF